MGVYVYITNVRYGIFFEVVEMCKTIQFQPLLTGLFTCSRAKDIPLCRTHNRHKNVASVSFEVFNALRRRQR